MRGQKGSAIMSIQAVGAGRCIDEGSKMNLLFRDGTRAEILSDGDFNCDGKFTGYFGGVFGKNKELSLLTDKEIETMRIWTSDGYVERDFSKAQSQIFKQAMNCIVND